MIFFLSPHDMNAMPKIKQKKKGGDRRRGGDDKNRYAPTEGSSFYFIIHHAAEVNVLGLGHRLIIMNEMNRIVA